MAGDGSTTAQTLTFDLGTITNSEHRQRDRRDGHAELHRARAEHRRQPERRHCGTTRPGSAGPWGATPATYQTALASAPPVTIVEPVLDATKAVVVNGAGTVGQAGGTVVYTMMITHAGATTTDAYDVTFSDPLPAQIAVPGVHRHPFRETGTSAACSRSPAGPCRRARLVL